MPAGSVLAHTWVASHAAHLVGRMNLKSPETEMRTFSLALPNHYSCLGDKKFAPILWLCVPLWRHGRGSSGLLAYVLANIIIP